MTNHYYFDTRYMVLIEIFKLFSASCALITAYLTLYDERISAHPGMLRALISMFLGGYIFAYNQQVHLCASRYDKVMAYMLAPIFHNMS
jgi:hypothetical protein